jgi:hypothetical protein
MDGNHSVMALLCVFLSLTSFYKSDAHNHSLIFRQLPRVSAAGQSRLLSVIINN